jgi:predicted amidophosphoribosyltransferase
LREHAPAIQAQAALEQAAEMARDADQLRGVELSAEARVNSSCTKCQATLAAGAKFCAQCGTPAAPEETATGPKFCAQCGGGLSAGARFCAGCGKPVS